MADSTEIKEFKKHLRPGWKSQTFAQSTSAKAAVRPRVGSAPYLGILDPPRSRPFIKGYNLRNTSTALRYWNYSRQFLEEPQTETRQSDKYDDSLRNQKHYELYLARLMLSLRSRQNYRTRQGFVSRSPESLSYQNLMRAVRYAYRFRRMTFYGDRQKTRFDDPWIPSMPRPPGWTPNIPPYLQPPGTTIIRPPRWPPFWPPGTTDVPVPTPPTGKIRRLPTWRGSPPLPPRETIRGGRWILIRIVRISQTTVRKTFLHTRTKAIRQKYYVEPLSRRHQSNYGRYRYRNHSGFSRRNRRRY